MIERTNINCFSSGWCFQDVAKAYQHDMDIAWAILSRVMGYPLGAILTDCTVFRSQIKAIGHGSRSLCVNIKYYQSLFI